MNTFAGSIRFFNDTWGFIERDDGAPDCFVHISAVKAAGLSGLKEKDRLSFSIESHNARPCAANLKLI